MIKVNGLEKISCYFGGGKALLIRGVTNVFLMYGHNFVAKSS